MPGSRLSIGNAEKNNTKVDFRFTFFFKKKRKDHLINKTSLCTYQIGRKKKWQYKMMSRIWRNGITHRLLSSATVEICLSFFYNTTHATTLWPSTCILGNLSQRSEDLCSYKNLYTNVHSSFICNRWKLETVHITFKKVKN